MNTTIRPLAVSVMFACWSMGAQAGDFSNAVILGDSLSDGGYYAAIGGQRFTTNPGKTAAEYVADNLGLSTTPSNQGGSNYAQGGAKVNSDSLSTPPGYAQRSVATQTNEYLASVGGKIPANTLVMIQGGANDAFQNMAAYGAGKISQADLGNLTKQSVVDLTTQVGRLAASGSPYIMVQNMPNLGVTPAFTSQGSTAAASASQLAQGFNSGLNSALSQVNGNIVYLDTYHLITEIVANPTAYGFTNATGVACTVSSSLFCSSNTLVSSDAASTYVFADGVHPTTAAQKINAQYALSVLNAPARVGLVSAAATSSGTSFANTLSQYVPQSGDQTWHVYGDVSHAKRDWETGSSQPTSFLLGADYRIGAKNNTRLGVTLGNQHITGNFDANSGSFKLNEPNASVYVSQNTAHNGWIAYMRYGRLNADIQRNITLGSAQRTESGSTKGSHITLGAQGHWDLGTAMDGKIQHGPIARLAYEKVHLKAYDEQSDSSTAMSFGEQNRKGWVGSVGYQVKGTFGQIKPYAALSYEFDNTRSDDLRARLKSAASSFARSGVTVGNGAKAQVGMQVQLAPNVDLNVSAAQTFARSSGKETSLNVGVNAKF